MLPVFSGFHRSQPQEERRHRDAQQGSGTQDGTFEADRRNLRGEVEEAYLWSKFSIIQTLLLKVNAEEARYRPSGDGSPYSA
jgi:hypothetical protein